MDRNIIEVLRMTKVFDDKDPVLDQVTFSIGSGEFVTIHGKSGCGKTTLLNILGGLDQPTSGRVSIDGQDLSRLSEDGLARLRLEKIGFVFQDFNLLLDLTIRENMMLPLRLAERRDNGRVDELLQKFGILHIADAVANKVSGGEAQRTAIARAMMNDPKIILADEPTGNLDDENSASVIDMFELAREDFGTTIVLATHHSGIAEHASSSIHLIDTKAFVEKK